MLQDFCASKRAFYIVDAPQLSTISGLIQSGPVGSTPGPITGTNASNSAYYFPWVQAPDPLFGNRPSLYPPCGFVAGIYTATDAHRGVWKAPAGIQASLTGVSGLQYNLTDLENGELNIKAINCLRQFKIYRDVVWGARTLQGNDHAGSEWKYIPIRRLALYIESSLYEGTQWVVFEPNDAPLVEPDSPSTSARSCRACSCRVRSRGLRRSKPTSSNATRKTTPRPASISA
jgi:phage tail sheath protein FI